VLSASSVQSLREYGSTWVYFLRQAMWVVLGLIVFAVASRIDHIRAVVAIGEAAPEVVAVFDGRVPVATATSMDEAVAAAAGFARRGDAVLLSPGCASYDWYRSYAERGDDFARAVHAHIGDAA
jgi:UDP-N-acetylmuramoylalanine--D-glutamate ligase